MSDFSPDTGPDGRPRPRFGEYATPEEQRAHIQQPDPALAPAAPSPAPLPAPAPAPMWGRPQDAFADPAAARPHPVDRIATIALLAYGALNVFLSAASFFDLPAVATQAMKILGIDAEFTNVAAAQLWGTIAAVVLVVGFVVTVVLALRRLRSGRLAWWIPLVGAVATYIVVYVCIAVPLFGDPAFTQYLTP